MWRLGHRRCFSCADPEDPCVGWVQRRLVREDVIRSQALERSHRDAYQTAVYLLRRAANELLQMVAIRFPVSPSRISKI